MEGPEEEVKTRAGAGSAAGDETPDAPGTGESAEAESVGEGGRPARDDEGKSGAEGERNDGLSPIEAFTENEGVEQRPNVSLREILGGDILTAGWLRRQMGLILLCMFFAIIYITNRYSAEQEMIEIERLKAELTEVKYRALTLSGELTEKTRQSRIEESLMQTADSVLESPKEPPFLIKFRNGEKE